MVEGMQSMQHIFKEIRLHFIFGIIISGSFPVSPFCS